MLRIHEAAKVTGRGGADAEFVRLAQQQIDPDFSMTSGADLAEIARTMANASPTSQAFMDHIYERIAAMRSGSSARFAS